MRHIPRLILLCSVAVAPLTAMAADFEGLFKGHSLDEPGCAVGVARQGQPITYGSYGGADLEHAVPVTPETIMETGSVSKQFTATAILLLAQDGKLALTDDIRKYLPEMPDYGTPITINHLLSHTSGLRDWGEVRLLAGWPRTDVVYTNQEALQIVARQKALNYKPGEAYSYTNTGFTLSAIIVERVSGKSFQDFTRERIFAPLGMTKTSWRTNFRRVLANRAIAYRAKDAEGYTQEMPFEDTYGHGGLLSTAHDLLTWNDALTSKKLGEFVTSHLEEQAVLNSGRKIAYARGLQHGTYKDVHEISHGGATAAYRTWLGRYPSLGMSVAVLCNGAGIDATKLGREAVEQLRPTPPKFTEVTGSAVLSAELSALQGVYVDERTGGSTRVIARDGALKLVNLHDKRESNLVRLGANRYKNGTAEMVFKGSVVERRTPDGDVTSYRKVDGYTPPAAELAALVGSYNSAEADGVQTLSVKEGRLVLTPANRPSVAFALTPLARDLYQDDEGLIAIVRDPAGKAQGIRFIHARAYNLTFARTAGPST